MISILCTIFLINSCSFHEHIEKNFKKINISNFFISKPKLIFLKFNEAVEKITLEILNSKNIFISNNTLFFINILKNKTNLILDNKNLTNIIKNKIFMSNNKIRFVQKKAINNTKKKLGLSGNDNFLDNSTALLLARKNNAKYYLYSCIFRKKEPFLLKIKLILVKTGEIVFMKTKQFYW